MSDPAPQDAVALYANAVAYIADLSTALAEDESALIGSVGDP